MPWGFARCVIPVIYYANNTHNQGVFKTKQTPQHLISHLKEGILDTSAQTCSSATSFSTHPLAAGAQTFTKGVKEFSSSLWDDWDV